VAYKKYSLAHGCFFLRVMIVVCVLLYCTLVMLKVAV
jgi:hypothetical protein